MDKSAIEKIQQSSEIEAINGLVNDTYPSSLPFIVIPKDMRVESLESMMPNASHYRFKFTTTSISDYIEYCKNNQQDDASCAIDEDDLRCKTIFDAGNKHIPGHKYHTAYLELSRTEHFKALLKCSDKTYSQMNASDFLENWGHFIACYDSSGNTMSLSAATKSIRDMTVKSLAESSSNVGDFSSSSSGFEQIEAKSQGSIVGSFSFICSPYLHFDEREFIFKVRILTSDDKPKIAFRLMCLEQHRESIADEFKKIITNGLSETNIKVYIGNIN